MHFLMVWFVPEPADVRFEAALSEGLVVRAGEDVELSAITAGKPIPKGEVCGCH